MSDLRKVTVEHLTHQLGLGFQMLDIDPAKDSVVSVLDKCNKMGASQLTLYVENGGFFCICPDAAMARRFREAIEKIQDEMDETLNVKLV